MQVIFHWEINQLGNKPIGHTHRLAIMYLPLAFSMYLVYSYKYIGSLLFFQNYQLKKVHLGMQVDIFSISVYTINVLTTRHIYHIIMIILKDPY